MRYSRLCLSMAAAGLTLAVSAAFAQGLPPTIKVGVSVPLTGASAVTGTSARIMVEMAAKEINAQGGIAGRPVELVIADDGADPTRAVNESKRLINQDKVNLILGPGSAAPALAAAPDITRAKILSFPNTGANTINRQSYPYGFGTFYSSDAFSDAMVDYAVDVLKAKSVAALVDNGAQGQAAGVEFKAYTAKRGVKLTSLETHDYDQEDISPQMLNLRRGNPDVILHVASNGDSVGRLFRASEEVGWKPIIISQVAALFPTQIKKLGGENVYSSGRVYGPTFKTLTMCKGENPSQAPYVQFVNRIKAFTPDASKVVVGLAPIYYDQLYLAKLAIEATKSVDGPTLATWIEQNSSKHSGLGGPYGATANYHLIWGASAIGMVQRPDQPDPSGMLPRAGC